MVFFGYTQCLDVYPTSMTEMVAIEQLLGADGNKFQGLFVTVDPERDEPEMLKACMAAFDPGFLALYTTPEKTAALAKYYKIYFKKVPGPTPTSYTVDTPQAAMFMTPTASCGCLSTTAPRQKTRLPTFVCC